jgi:hypothetical protein
MAFREEQLITRHPTEVQVHQDFYRGYRIGVFGEGSAWSFKLSRTTFALPSTGPRSIFFKIANTERRALSLAKIEIDWLLAQKNSAKRAKRAGSALGSGGLSA